MTKDRMINNLGCPTFASCFSTLRWEAVPSTPAAVLLLRVFPFAPAFYFKKNELAPELITTIFQRTASVNSTSSAPSR
jgi:hypothetical protein